MSAEEDYNDEDNDVCDRILWSDNDHDMVINLIIMMMVVVIMIK